MSSRLRDFRQHYIGISNRTSVNTSDSTLDSSGLTQPEVQTRWPHSDHHTDHT